MAIAADTAVVEAITLIIEVVEVVEFMIGEWAKVVTANRACQKAAEVTEAHEDQVHIAHFLPPSFQLMD
jgi:hypothetical protein